MGKTYRSYDKFDSFDENKGRSSYRNKKLKISKVKEFRDTHKDKKMEALKELPGANDDPDDWSIN